MPFFSVIIPTYNRYNFVKRAIESVIHQSYKDFELIIVDDGSTDNTRDIEDEYAGQLIYIRQKNSGISGARNWGIENSNSEYITFLDSDDKWLPNKLKEHFKFIKNNPDIRIHQTDEIWIRKGKQVNPRNKHKKKEGDIFLNSLELCLISPSAVVLKRDLFNDYGYFDELLPACEDYDLWLRITSREKIGLIKKYLIEKYGGHDDQLSNKYWGMDRFRIYSIVKVLTEYGPELSEEYLTKAKDIAIQKCNILLTGALKRKKYKFSDEIKKIILMLNNEYYSSIDCQILLEK